jgi:hypothetical protein
MCQPAPARSRDQPRSSPIPLISAGARVGVDRAGDLSREVKPVPRTRRAHNVLALAASLLSLHCGGSVQNGSDAGPSSPTNLPAPTDHRPTAAPCSMTRPPGINMTAGHDGGLAGTSCTSDSQCTSGKNGRCMQSGDLGPTCTYDQCFTDSQCGKEGVCECGTPADDEGRYPNTCLDGNCQVDADCGDGGYCSPSYDTSCGPFSGYVGYYCHTSKDECTNDDECTEGGAGYCAWQPTKSLWTCFYQVCAG